jgi:hypothetical protein
MPITIDDKGSPKVTGEITSISEPKTLNNGAKTVTFTIKNNDGYNGKEQTYAFEMYFSTQKMAKLDEFKKYQKVGQTVEVKFRISCNPWKDRDTGELKGYFTKLSAWNVFGQRVSEDAQRQADYNNIAGGVTDGPPDDENLPF